VAFVTTLAAGRGIVALRLDGGEWHEVDLYRASTLKKRVVWAASVLPGPHTLEIAVTGTKNAASSKSRVDVDAFLVR
jgi:hypothetical protein